MNTKKYVYDEVIAMLNTNGPIDEVLVDFQKKVGELEELLDTMQTLFHGKNGKDIYKLYSIMYNQIGNKTSEFFGTGFWGVITNMSNLHNKMYSRAMYDKKLDEEEINAGRIGL